MRIVADENIPCVDDAFGSWGEIRKMPGSAITPASVRGADLLLVRSVTQVNAALLEGSHVRHVASATSGTDHVDRRYLESADIAFFDAPGSNADAVAQYVLTALSAIGGRLPAPLTTLSIGIVGAGEVGSRLSALCEALGMRVVLNDPPRAKATGDPRYRPLEEVFECDVVTLHVPLVDAGAHPTRSLVEEKFLAAMRPDAALINAARGGVVDESALKQALSRAEIAACVLDVWRNEPGIDAELLHMAQLGTPHIAGYSVEGKLRGTQMIHDRLASALGRESTWDFRNHLPAPPPPIRVSSPLRPGELFEAVYDIRADDVALRNAVVNENASGFDRLRRTYPARREFSAFRLAPEGLSEGDRAWLTALGFATA